VAKQDRLLSKIIFPLNRCSWGMPVHGRKEVGDLDSVVFDALKDPSLFYEHKRLAWHVIIDLALPPTGGLTPFNAYVALSRSSGRDTIRLLRPFQGLFMEPSCDILAAEDERRNQETSTSKVICTCQDIMV